VGAPVHAPHGLRALSRAVRPVPVDYYRTEAQAIGDSTLEQEEAILEKLEGFEAKRPIMNGEGE